MTRARLAGDGQTWEKTLTRAGAYRVSLRPAAPGSADPVTVDAVTVDAAEQPVTIRRDPAGALSLPASSTWIAPSGAAADGLVSSAATTATEDAVLGATPARTLWDGLRSRVATGTDDVGAPDERVVASGVVVTAADAATGAAPYAASSVGTTRPLGVRTTADGRATVYMATEGSTGTDVVSAVSVDSTGAPISVGVTVLPARDGATGLDDPQLARAFGWDDPDAEPLALSARLALDGSTAGDGPGGGSLSAASSLLAALGVEQWSGAGSSGDPVTGFARAARAEGSLYARTGTDTADEPATGLEPSPGGIPLTWDTVVRGPGDGVGFDGRSWAPAGPCG